MVRGLTDREQSIVTLVSIILILISALPFPPGLNPSPEFRYVIGILGAIGLAIKEWLGSNSGVTIVPAR